MGGDGGEEEEASVIINTVLMYEVLKNKMIRFKKKIRHLNIKIGKVMVKLGQSHEQQVSQQ